MPQIQWVDDIYNVPLRPTSTRSTNDQPATFVSTEKPVSSKDITTISDVELNALLRVVMGEVMRRQLAPVKVKQQSWEEMRKVLGFK